ncbi:hypothetical protein EJB05_32184, partial [Eragrostis curvula]
MAKVGRNTLRASLEWNRTRGSAEPWRRSWTGSAVGSLPDEILHSILRGLRLKHAARTSARSSRWPSLWLRALAASSVIDFTDRDFVGGQTPEQAAATYGEPLPPASGRARSAARSVPYRTLGGGVDAVCPSTSNSENQSQLPRELHRAVVESRTAAALTSVVDDSGILIHGDDFLLGHLKLIKVANFRGTRLEFVLLSFLTNRAPALEQLVLTTVDEDEAPGDELLKIIQERVSAMRKASPVAQVTVCRPSQDRNHNPAHTRFYHEEA